MSKMAIFYDSWRCIMKQRLIILLSIVFAVSIYFALYVSFPAQNPLTSNSVGYVTKPSKNENQTSNMNLANHNNSTYPTVKDIRHIGFLKVHKAGSSTVLNILFRFGLKRNLTFAIPRNSNHFDPKTTLPVRVGGHYDILAVHSIFRKEQFDALLPADKVNIGIIREPLERMISAAYYYLDVFKVPYLRQIPKSYFIQELINHPEKYERQPFSPTKNAMGYDFGFHSTTKEKEVDKIEQQLNFLKQEFKLVLVANRFKESMVLMKRYLGWQMSDILFLPLNEHRHTDVNLTEGQKLKLKHTCFMDYAIYDFFSKVFDSKVQAEGPLFQEEVKQFEKVLQETTSFCNLSKSVDDKLTIPDSRWNKRFEVSHSECNLMKLPALKFISDMRKRHIQMNGLIEKTVIKNKSIVGRKHLPSPKKPWDKRTNI